MMIHFEGTRLVRDIVVNARSRKLSYDAFIVLFISVRLSSVSINYRLYIILAVSGRKPENEELADIIALCPYIANNLYVIYRKQGR